MGKIPCWLLDSDWRYYPLYELNIFRKHEYICIMYIYLYFLSFHPYWVGAGSQHSYQCRTRTCLSYRTDIMATDVLETQVAKSSSAVVLTKFSSVIPASSAEGLTSDNLIDFWASYDDQAIHIWCIVADAKWPPFRRWHFQKHFLNVSIRISVKKSLRFIPRVQLTITHHWFRQWLCADQAPNHYLNQRWLDYRCIYASHGLNDLINQSHDDMEILLAFLGFCGVNPLVTNHWYSPPQRACHMELWFCFVVSLNKLLNKSQFAIRDVMMLMWHHCNV